MVCVVVNDFLMMTNNSGFFYCSVFKATFQFLQRREQIMDASICKLHLRSSSFSGMNKNSCVNNLFNYANDRQTSTTEQISNIIIQYHCNPSIRQQQQFQGWVKTHDIISFFSFAKVLLCLQVVIFMFILLSK